MKRLRIRTVAIFAVGVLSGVLLLRTSQDVQDAAERLANIDRQVEKEQEAIRVLKAEWEYLNSPIRLEQLATDYLDLEAMEPEQMMVEPDDLSEPYIPAVDYAPAGDVYEALKPEPVHFTAKPSEEGRGPAGEGSAAGVVKPKAKPDRVGSKPKPHKGFDELLKDLSEGGQP